MGEDGGVLVTLVVDWCPPFPLSAEQLDALDAVRPEDASLRFERADDDVAPDQASDLTPPAVLRVVLDVELADLADAEEHGLAIADEIEHAVGVDGRVVAVAAIGDDAQRSWQYP